MPMNMTLPELLAHASLKYQEWKGRLIAYGGGGSVSLVSYEVSAKAQEAAQVTTPDIALANIISIGGLVAIFARLAFDVFVHFDKKKGKGDPDER